MAEGCGEVSPIGEGWMAAALIVLCAALPTEIWRWLGLIIGQRINPHGGALLLVRAIATGIIAAFVAHSVLFPTGALAMTSIVLRVIAVAAALIVFFIAGRQVFLGVGAGVVALIIGVSWFKG